MPDVPISVADSACTRFREIARDGFLVVTEFGVDVAPVREAAAEATGGPVRVLALADIDVTDALTEALRARPGEVWVIRPDAHVAAVLTTPGRGDVVRALRRAQGALCTIDPATIG